MSACTISEKESLSLLSFSGEITSASGGQLTAKLPKGALGDLCTINTQSGTTVAAQIIGFHDDRYILSPFSHSTGISPHSRVDLSRAPLSVPVGEELLGKVVDALGRTLPSTAHETIGKVSRCKRVPILAAPPHPLSRMPVSKPLVTGVSSIDGLLTLGRGQRIGIFASAGIGKSTLLAMLTRNAEVDVTVVALVGERGREVQEFVNDTLGARGMAKTIVVVATSDQPSLMRQIAASTATSIAEFFRDQGKNVLLIVDSLTRTARAIRETSLASGELPVRQGYTPSVYTELPRLLERAGNNDKGTISALYTVLTNEEGENDPLADEIKSVLDGHIVLSKEYAQRGILPAIDIPKSISRIMPRLHNPEYSMAAKVFTTALAQLDRERFTVLLGGTPDEKLARSIQVEPEMLQLLSQELTEVRASYFTRAEVERIARLLSWS